GQTRTDQRLVREVMPREQRRDALEERALRDGTRGREQAVHGPLDAIREWNGGGLALGPIAKPPATRLDLLDPSLVLAPELVPDQGDHALHGVARWRRSRERPRPREGSSGPGGGVLHRLGLRRSAEHARSGLERRTVVRLGLDVVVDDVRCEQPAQLARAIQPDEDLAEEALVASGLAAGAENLDGCVHDRRGGLARRERSGLDVLGRR